jgi:hypothetical protein
MNFNSNHISNLNLLPKGKLFLIFHSIGLKGFINFGGTEGWLSQFINMVQFGKIRKSSSTARAHEQCGPILFQLVPRLKH